MHAAAPNARKVAPELCALLPAAAPARAHCDSQWRAHITARMRPPTLTRSRRSIRLEFPARTRDAWHFHALVTPAVGGMFRDHVHDSTSDLTRYPGTGSSVTRRHKRTRPPNRGGPAFITEILMSLSRRGSIITPLFPKEQVPASTPIPPRGRDHLFSPIVAIP
jgi:hypothetical protein